MFVAKAGANRIALHQGANDGFRSVFLYCIEGPDRDKGFVIFCNADYSGTYFNAQLAQHLLSSLEFSGVDYSKFSTEYDLEDIDNEQKVNKGLKALVFDAFTT